MSIEKKDEVYFVFTCGGTQIKIFDHFIQHHLDIGIKKENIYFCYHKNVNISNEYHIAWQNTFKNLGLNPAITIESEFDSKRIQLEPLVKIKSILPKSSWVVRTDTDCFIELIGCDNIYDFCNIVDNDNASYSRAVVVDRITPDGELKDIEQEKNIFEQFPIALKDYGRLRQLYKAHNNIPLDSTPKTIFNRPRESLVFLHRNFINYSTSVHNIDFPDDPNIKCYSKLGILHHFKWDKTFLERHRKDMSILGKKYNRSNITGVYETFRSSNDNYLDIDKIKSTFKKQTEPKLMKYSAEFPSNIGEPKWI